MMTASVPGMPRRRQQDQPYALRRDQHVDVGVQLDAGAKHDVHAPLFRGVTLAPVAVQRSSTRLSVKARHTRSTGTPMSVRKAKLR